MMAVCAPHRICAVGPTFVCYEALFMKLTKVADLDVRLAGGDDGDGGGPGPAVILMHGFGASGDDLVPLWRVLRAPRGTRFLFPAAPIALGREYMGGRAWWWIDIDDRIRRRASGERNTAEVPDGLGAAREKADAVLTFVETSLSPRPPKVVLGGFSQGAMVALDVALHSSLPLAGLLLMSGTHVAAHEWAPRLEARRGLPVFMSHGREDPILPFDVSEKLRDTLVAAGLPVDWVEFAGGHGIPEPVIQGAAAFLGRVLA